MALKDFVSKGWADHGDDAEGVLARLPEGVGMVAEVGDMPGLAGLIVHVAGEHCGKWDEGLALLGQLVEHDAFDGDAPAAKSVCRSAAILHHCVGRDPERDAWLERGLSGADSQASDRVRVLAVAASALAGQRRTGDAISAFTEALDLASYGPEKGDPAATALAITGNNLAASLEEKAERTDDENRLMLQAARTGRRFWEIAGTWTNVERAEYRLAMTNLQLGDADQAIQHAQLCHDICVENTALPGELFFAHEALAKAWHHKGDVARATDQRDKAAACVSHVKDEGFRSFCQGELTKLNAAFA